MTAREKRERKVKKNKEGPREKRARKGRGWSGAGGRRLDSPRGVSALRENQSPEDRVEGDGEGKELLRQMGPGKEGRDKQPRRR